MILYRTRPWEGPVQVGTSVARPVSRMTRTSPMSTMTKDDDQGCRIICAAGLLLLPARRSNGFWDSKRLSRIAGFAQIENELVSSLFWVHSAVAHPTSIPTQGRFTAMETTMTVATASTTTIRPSNSFAAFYSVRRSGSTYSESYSGVCEH